MRNVGSPDIHECFRGLTGSQRTLGIWGVSRRKKYVYLAQVKIIIKKLFPGNLNAPVVISLHDKRLIQTNENHLGSIQGNLAYTKLMFTCYPKYKFNLGDTDFDNSLSLYFKFLRNDFMKEGNNVMTI